MESYTIYKSNNQITEIKILKKIIIEVGMKFICQCIFSSLKKKLVIDYPVHVCKCNVLCKFSFSGQIMPRRVIRHFLGVAHLDFYSLTFLNNNWIHSEDSLRKIFNSINFICWYANCKCENFNETIIYFS